MADLRDENRRLRDETAALRRGVGEVSLENSDLKAKIRALEENLMEAMAKVIALQEARQ